MIYSTSHTCEIQSFLVLGVRSSEFGGAILGVHIESEKRYKCKCYFVQQPPAILSAFCLF